MPVSGLAVGGSPRHVPGEGHRLAGQRLDGEIDIVPAALPRQKSVPPPRPPGGRALAGAETEATGRATQTAAATVDDLRFRMRRTPSRRIGRTNLLTVQDAKHGQESIDPPPSNPAAGQPRRVWPETVKWD
jgi:hypothetical protein